MKYFLLVLGMVFSGYVLAEQTYYTWTDVDGIIHITTTPPPQQAETQLHNVTEYQAPATNHFYNYPPDVGIVSRGYDESPVLSKPPVAHQQTPEPRNKTKIDQLFEAAKREKQQCRENFSDSNDVKQCISRVNYSLRLRFRLLKNKQDYPIHPDISIPSQD